MHICYQLCAFFRPACAADPLAIADSADRRLTLKRPKHKLLTLYHVKANPVNVLERDAQNRRRIRKNCCFVCFVLRIFFKLFLQKRVKSTFFRRIFHRDICHNKSFLSAFSFVFYNFYIGNHRHLSRKIFLFFLFSQKGQKHLTPCRREPLQIPRRIGRTGRGQLHRRDAESAFLIFSI